MVDETTLLEMLNLIDLRRWGRGRIGLVTHIHQLAADTEDGWVTIGYRGLKAATGCSDRWIRELLFDPGHLWRNERVLERRELGAGTRGTAWRVNPHLDRWRGVPWIDPDPHSRDLRLSRVRHRRAEEELARRSLADALNTIDDLLARGSGADALAALGISLARRHTPTRKQPFSASVKDRRASNSISGPSLLLSRDACASLSEGPSGPEREIDHATQTVIDAIVARGSYVKGRLYGELRDLMATGPDLRTVLEAVAQAPPELQGYMVVHGPIADVVAGTYRAAAPVPNVVGRAEQLRQKIDGIRRFIDLCESQGSEPGQKNLDDLAACQTELDALLEVTTA